MSHSVADGKAAGASGTEDLSKVGACEVTVDSYVPGAKYAATSMGDLECMVECTVCEVGADEPKVESSFEDKHVHAECTKGEGCYAVTAGDGANDLLVSGPVDAGPVTGGGSDTVKEAVDTTSIDMDSVVTACSCCTS